MTTPFADDALFAYWDGEGEETAPREIARGPDAIGRLLAADDRRPEILVVLREGADCFVEGRLRTAGGDTAATFVASLQLDDDGAIARCLCFHGPPVEPSASWDAEAPAPAAAARPALDRYFRHLIAGEFAEAAACFSEDCLYSHPPYVPGGPRVAFRGRGKLLSAFAGQRGNRPARPRIVRCLQRGSDCFIEGVVDGIPDGGSFVSSVSLDRDGLILRYVAFYTRSRIARRRTETMRFAHAAHRP